VIERPEFEMRTLCEMSSARASAFTQKYPGIDVQANLDDVLRDPKVDAVVVATPPRTHHAIVKAALEAGKHVLVEKPLATTSADADRPRRPGDGRRPGAHAGSHVLLQPVGQQGP
jgi:predicted dehydrogenase